jgi:hypothetical protein
MQLRKVEIAPEHDITHEIFCVKMPSVHHNLPVLIMKFSGVYGHGARGNIDAEYMKAMTRAAIEFTHPFGLIFDFRDLSYEWGDMMGAVLCAGEGRWVKDPMPLAIVVSERCETAITSLLKQELQVKDYSKLMHRTLDSAVSYVDEEHMQWRSNVELKATPARGPARRSLAHRLREFIRWGRYG